MTPEQLQQFTEAMEQLKTLMEWYHARLEQALPYPLDDASKAAIGGVLAAGTGSTSLTQGYAVGGGSITGPKAYLGSVIISVDGKLVEVPYISAP